MLVNVLIVIESDGTFVASCQDFPEIQATGADADDCSRNVMLAFWNCLASRANAGEDVCGAITLTVSHLGPDPALAATYDWEVVMPEHRHNTI